MEAQNDKTQTGGNYSDSQYAGDLEVRRTAKLPQQTYINGQLYVPYQLPLDVDFDSLNADEIVTDQLHANGPNYIAGYATTAAATYTPGDGIDIAGNVITNTEPGVIYTPGAGIDITGTVITNTASENSTFTGPITTADTTAATPSDYTTAALVIPGGGAIQGTLNVGEFISQDGTTGGVNGFQGAVVIANENDVDAPGSCALDVGGGIIARK